MKVKRFSPIIVLSVIYLFNRLFKILELPPFIDEFMYAGWAKDIALYPLKNAFISLTDGQQPLYFWILSPLTLLFKNPILAIRLFSVFTGLVNVILLYLIGKKLFVKKGNHKGLPLQIMHYALPIPYILSPFFFWYDRIGIKDSLVTTIALAVFYFSFTQNFILLTIALTLGLYIKSITYLFIPLILLNTAILFIKKSYKPGMYLLTCVAISILLSLLQNLFPATVSIASKNSTFLYSIQELLAFPISIWRNNIYSLITWIITYITPPVLIVSILGMFHTFKKSYFIPLISWFIFPVAVEVVTAKIFFPRYILFSTFPILIFFTLGLYYTLRKLKYIIPAAAIALLPCTVQIVFIYFNLTNAYMVPADRWQYFEGWPSGYGFKKMLVELNKLPDHSIIYTENTSLTDAGIRLSLPHKNFQIIPLFLHNTDEVLNTLKTVNIHSNTTTYLLFNIRQNIPAHTQLTKIVETYTVFNKSKLSLYQFVK